MHININSYILDFRLHYEPIALYLIQMHRIVHINMLTKNVLDNKNPPTYEYKTDNNITITLTPF